MGFTGKPLPHDSAVGHVTGTAMYVEDLPPLADELWVEAVGSPIAAGTITALDVTAAAEVPGVVALFTHRDLPGVNHFGPIFSDEPFLVEDQVHYVGQPIVVLAAQTQAAARRAKGLVRLQYRESPALLTIDQAIAADSFIGPERRICRGSFDNALSAAAHRIEGVFQSNGQEQFYFESQAALAIPGEQQQLRILCSTQNPTETQIVVAEALGLRMHEVVCECQRMGGAFGGKETQSALPAVMAALVAHHTRRPARIAYRKDEDMRVTGKRHAYKTWYRAGCDKQGRLLAVQMKLFSNGGAFADLSTSVMERSLLHADNAYYLPVADLSGRICRTNLPPNTAFRGFGGPQSIVVIENLLQEISQRLGCDAIDVRKRNLYVDGSPQRNTTPYGQIVEHHVLGELYDQLEESCDYRRRQEAIAQFNATSATHLRGLAMSAVKFGISFTTKFLNQANALVNVYTDGSVQVSTGGTEMGQGLNTKIRQLVADEFGVDYNHIRLMATSTEKNNNTSPTAASAGTDLNGAAALQACQKIKARLAQFAAERFASGDAGLTRSPEHVEFVDGHVADRRIADPGHRIAFGDLCAAARRQRVDLGARGFYATPGVDFNRETGRGNPFYYFTTGTAATQVTIDRFTGEYTIDRTDLLMDVGQMINPGVDRGQVIGGFIQGMGWCTTEELRYDDQGHLLTTGPTTYKIPNITDLPREFHVDFLANPKHQQNVRLSKAVGEPPLMLGISAWLAIKHALSFVNPARVPPLKLPATNEETLLCLTDLVTAGLASNEPTPNNSKTGKAAQAT
jgi:xanthine dehydrogenase large subunit